MKFIIIVSISAILFPLTTGAMSHVNAESLLRNCKTTLAAKPSDLANDPVLSVFWGLCSGYFNGAISNHEPFWLCFTIKGVDLRKIIAAFVVYAGKIPKLIKIAPEYTVFHEFIVETYPGCRILDDKHHKKLEKKKDY